MNEQIYLSLTQQKIYDALKTSGDNGSTTLLGLMKLIYPAGTLHSSYNISIPIMYLYIHHINQKIKPKGEKIAHLNGTRGYTLKKIK